MMLYRVVMELRTDCPKLKGITEDLGMYCERVGDLRVVSVTEVPAAMPEQIVIGGKDNAR